MKTSPIPGNRTKTFKRALVKFLVTHPKTAYQTRVESGPEIGITQGPPHQHPDKAAPSISDYELITRIGSGAYGEVWLARNLATGAQRAIKIVYRATFTDERPFHREFEGIKKFELISHSHPSQLSLFHVGQNKEAGYFYYVMELADSAPQIPDNQFSITNYQSAPYQPHTLRSDLNQSRLPRVLEIALTLTEALSHLHQNGLIHRDVKPSNIIFIQGRPKLADIGLVTDASDSRSIVGTEGYLPAEGPGTPQADLFALGKVLYETLTGLDRRQYPELPADLRAWPDAKLAFELNTIVLKLCAAHPRDRYPTAESLLNDLKHLHAGKSIQRRHWFRRFRSIVLKAALSLALVLAAFMTYRRNQTTALITPTPESDFAHSGTTNYAAWEASERAGSLGERFSLMGFSNAITYYHRALQLDPNFTRAWINLAMAEYLSVEKGFVPGPDALHRSLAAAEKALSLDPNSGAALHWKASCNLALDYDFPRAQPLLEKSTKLSPRYVWRHNYAGILWKYGRLDEAEKMLREVLHESPEQGYSHLVLGFVLGARGKLPEALSEMDDSVLLLPNGFPVTYLERGLLRWIIGRQDEACNDWLNYIRLGGFPMINSDDPVLAAASKVSPEQFVRTLIAQLEKCRADGVFVSSFDLARFNAVLGEKSRALDYLELCVDEHRPFALCAKQHFSLRDLQNEPRYHAVLRRLKLE